MNLKTASIGSISHGTLRPEDLIETFTDELEGLQALNGKFLSRPENFPLRDSIANLIGEAQDCWNEDGEELNPDCEPDELIDSLIDYLNEFAPPYCIFGAHCGDGSDFGFWPMDIEEIKKQVEFVSVRSLSDAEQMGIKTDPEDSTYPPADFRGEWLHVNDHGNCTLYCREDAYWKNREKVSADSVEFEDREVWSIC